MIPDLTTIYLVIAMFYTIIAMTFSILEEEGFVNPVGAAIVSTIVGFFAGWILFPILLLYNLFIRKRII